MSSPFLSVLAFPADPIRVPFMIRNLT